MQGRSDVLVIGAGPAGSAAAITAARAGARVCLVDRARFPRPKTCGDALSNEAANIVTELGAGEALARAPKAVVRGAAAIFPDGSRVRRSYGRQPGYIVARDVLDDLLRRAAEAAGCQVVEGVHIRSVEREGSRFRVARGSDFEWSADAIVAADGPGSVAWTALGTRPPRGRALGLAITAYYEGLGPALDPGYSEHYFDDALGPGYAWIFPDVAGLTNIGVYQRADRYRRGDSSLKELLSRFTSAHTERFAGARQVGRSRSWQLPLAAGSLPSGAPGLLLCGDAARLIDPLSGEGIWHALASGRLAGGATAAAVAGGGLDRAAVRRYQLQCAREIAWPTSARIAIQQAMSTLVALGLYRSNAVRRALQWGYARGATEIAKAVNQ